MEYVPFICRIPRLVVAGVVLGIAALAAPAPRAEPAVGGELPAVTIEDKGELLIEGDKAQFQTWSTASLRGKPAYLQYVAARKSASDLNKPFSDALEAAAIPDGKIHVAAVVNAADALWGTGGFIAGELEQNKKRYPHSMIVHDASGVGRETWGLEENSSAVIILDPHGKVLFARQGALLPEEITRALQLLRAAIAQ